jgi:hypothetical protein
MDHCPGKTALVTDLSFSYPTDPRCDAGLLLETSDAGLKFYTQRFIVYLGPSLILINKGVLAYFRPDFSRLKFANCIFAEATPRAGPLKSQDPDGRPYQCSSDCTWDFFVLPWS